MTPKTVFIFSFIYKKISNQLVLNFKQFNTISSGYLRGKKKLIHPWLRGRHKMKVCLLELMYDKVDIDTYLCFIHITGQ